MSGSQEWLLGSIKSDDNLYCSLIRNKSCLQTYACYLNSKERVE